MSQRSIEVKVGALILVALGLAVLAAQPEYLLVVLAYTYLASAFIGVAWSKLRKRDHHEPIQEAPREQDLEAHNDGLATKDTTVTKGF